MLGHKCSAISKSGLFCLQEALGLSACHMAFHKVVVEAIGMSSWRFACLSTKSLRSPVSWACVCGQVSGIAILGGLFVRAMLNLLGLPFPALGDVLFFLLLFPCLFTRSPFSKILRIQQRENPCFGVGFRAFF